MSQCLCGPGFSKPAWCEDGRCGPCLKCLPGTYKTESSNQLCDACPPFTTSLVQAGNLSDCVCQVGYGLANEACSICPAGEKACIRACTRKCTNKCTHAIQEDVCVYIPKVHTCYSRGCVCIHTKRHIFYILLPGFQLSSIYVVCMQRAFGCGPHFIL